MEGVRGSIPLPPTINANEIKYFLHPLRWRMSGLEICTHPVPTKRRVHQGMQKPTSLNGRRGVSRSLYASRSRKRRPSPPTGLTEITVRYFAYGSNLNVAQMTQRCPGAKPLGRIELSGWKSVFRGVADAIQEPGAFCYGGVWRITPEDEAALDESKACATASTARNASPLNRCGIAKIACSSTR